LADSSAKNWIKPTIPLGASMQIYRDFTEHFAAVGPLLLMPADSFRRYLTDRQHTHYFYSLGLRCLGLTTIIDNGLPLFITHWITM
jgi:hypothetical protein